MYRINDNYNWRTLEHWRTAVEKGNVQLKKLDQGKCSDDVLRHALKLLECDCFPIAMICCLGEEGQKEVWLTSLWEGIFDFLDGKRGVGMAEEEIWFHKMQDSMQNKYLCARIASVWVKMD